MAEPYFAPGENRAARVNELFTAIARRYDLINDLQSFGLHRSWKQKVVRLAMVNPGDKALDICCGTGDLTLALTRAGAATVGLDFNEAMLSIARNKAARNVRTFANDAPHFVQGDALSLGFPDHSFDIITIGYGLRNLASWENGLEEMLRVARPGGRLIILEFGKPDHRLFRSLYFGYLRFFVPVLGRVFCGDSAAYAYILRSLKEYPGQKGISKRMGELGMEHVRIYNFLGGAMSINYGEKRRK